MTAESIRSQNDRKLFDLLRNDPDVVAAQAELDSLKEQGYVGMRRHLLATSVRLSRNMAKPLHAAAEECAERLALELPLELYAYANPQFNAACISPEEGTLFIMFSSSLLESFHGRELCFVMGHEIGHYIYKHHDIPIGFMLNGRRPVGPRLALDLFAWSRYAEISADRAGAYCADDMHAVGLALFRLASGLDTNTIDFDLGEFLAQIDDIQASDAEPGQGVHDQLRPRAVRRGRDRARDGGERRRRSGPDPSRR